jgi:hypothetical protein
MFNDGGKTALQSLNAGFVQQAADMIGYAQVLLADKNAIDDKLLFCFYKRWQKKQ